MRRKADRTRKILQKDDSSPSLKASRALSRGNFLPILELAIGSAFWQGVEFEIGPAFWPEVFSALSMAAPSLYAYHAAPELASKSVFPEGIWALAVGSMLHCPFSMAYHLACAVLDRRDDFDPMCTPFRTMDMTAIHLAAIAFAWALSQGSWFFTLLMVLVNLSCIFLLARRLILRRPGSLDENMRVTACVFLYTLPLLLRGDSFHYAAVMGSWLGACFFFLIGNRVSWIGGWSHGLFHLMLTPFLHFMMLGVSRFSELDGASLPGQ